MLESKKEQALAVLEKHAGSEELPTKGDLAKEAGMDIKTFSRAIGALEEEGKVLIGIAGRKMVSIEMLSGEEEAPEEEAAPKPEEAPEEPASEEEEACEEPGEEECEEEEEKPELPPKFNIRTHWSCPSKAVHERGTGCRC